MDGELAQGFTAQTRDHIMVKVNGLAARTKGADGIAKYGIWWGVALCELLIC